MHLHSLKRDNLLALKELSETSCVEVSTSDHEVADPGDIQRLLALLLEFELSLILDVLFDRFRGHCGALLLDLAQLDGLWVSKEPTDEVSAKEYDALTRVLELFSELRQVRDVKSWTVLV